MTRLKRVETRFKRVEKLSRKLSETVSLVERFLGKRISIEFDVCGELRFSAFVETDDPNHILCFSVGFDQDDLERNLLKDVSAEMRKRGISGGSSVSCEELELWLESVGK